MRYVKLIFSNESLDYLINTGEHCVHKNYIKYLTEEKPKIANKKKRDYKIGIIIPNYNYGEWIEKCLNSILQQTYKNYEVIFVDDISKDNSVEIAKSFKDKMNIKIIELKQKRYSGGARNEGYLYLSKDVDYIYYMDSDDWLIDNKVLEKINENLKGEPDVLFVGLGADYNGIVRSYYAPKYNNKYEAIIGWSGSTGKVIKKELATRQECLYQEGTLKEDRTQHYKICINMETFKCLQEVVYIWNKNNEKSVTTIRNDKWKVDTLRNYADAIELYDKVKGQDIRIDEILMTRIYNCKKELEEGNDSQQ